jgi:hypothetical protein
MSDQTPSCKPFIAPDARERRAENRPAASSQFADQYTTPLAGQNDFVACVDAIGELDGARCLLEWKTTASRYPEEPAGLLALDPQLVCYSWVTGIADVAQGVFVRKRLVEIQYFRTTISDEQREEFGHLVAHSSRRIEAAEFLPHSGIRFPQNPCTTLRRERPRETCWSAPQPGMDSPAELKELLGFVSQKGLNPSTQIDGERRRVFAFAPPLQTLQLVHGA